MKNYGKKLVSMILVITMIVLTFPTFLFAEEMKTTEDSQTVADTNYRGSGRTRIAFHIQYEGEDASGYYDKMWMEGWGVSFGAYYDWKDADISNAATNIAAFMPAKTDDEALLGTDNEVMPDASCVSSLPYLCSPGVCELTTR